MELFEYTTMSRIAVYKCFKLQSLFLHLVWIQGILVKGTHLCRNRSSPNLNFLIEKSKTHMTKAPGMDGFQSPSICLTQDAKQLTEHSAPSCGFPYTKEGNKSALQLSSVTLDLLLFLLAPPAEFLNAA